LVEAYAYEKLGLCKRVNPNMEETDKIQHFIQGLKGSLKLSVITKNFQSFHAALKAAKRQKEAQRSIKKLSAQLGSNEPKLPTKEEIPVNYFEILEKLRKIEEKLKDQTKNDSVRAIHEEYSHKRKSEAVEPSVRRSRNSWRTMDGQIICMNCQKVGHMARSCPEKRMENEDIRTEEPEQKYSKAAINRGGYHRGNRGGYHGGSSRKWFQNQEEKKNEKMDPSKQKINEEK
jgi:hypothetical protein